MAKPKRFVLVGDNHGDLEDKESIAAVHKFNDDYKPEILIHLGDNWDFRNLRRGASPGEQNESLEDDYRIGLEFFDTIFSHGKERYFLLGNHDIRPWQHLNSTSAVIRDYAKALIARIEGACKKRKVKMFPYDSEAGVLELGELRVIHGYHHGISACRQHANVYRNCFFGHVHSIESAPVPSHKPSEAHAIGCLCKRDIDYINAKTAKLRWANGFVYGLLFDDGSYHYEQARKIRGKFCIATDFKFY